MQRSLLLSAFDRPPSAASAALFQKGFRPFFLLAAMYAVVIVPLWLAILNGLLSSPTYLEPAVWHAHEMLYGFATAVVAGFLLTAVGNWTQRETAVGRPLALLALLWLAGRGAMLLASGLPRGLPALVDSSFIPVLMVVLGRPLIATGNRRNFVMLGVLGALFVANVAVHLHGLGVLAGAAARRANLAGVDIIALLILVIGGRVFPMFTRNATGESWIRSHPGLDRACVVAMGALACSDALGHESIVARFLPAVVGLLAIARAWHWGTLASRRDPLLWILHAGYFWLALGLLLRGVGGWLGVPFESVAVHAITVGSIGSLTLGMMARVSLGHTGRMLAAPRPMRLSFWAMTTAALARVLTPWLIPGSYREGLIASGLSWMMAFAIFLAVYAPVLLQPRVDGRPG